MDKAYPLPSQKRKSTEVSKGSPAFPKTIIDVKGQTIIESKPKRIAITYFPYAEHLFAIGEQDAVAGVVGLSSLQNFKVYQPYTSQNKIQNLGDKINLERILALQPDLIIISDQDEALYDQLSKIAKTIIVPISENWQDTIMLARIIQNNRMDGSFCKQNH
ncbi:ABC transporter substrate-binding protein [Paenibacillus terrae]